MEKNTIIASSPLATLPPPTTRNTDPILLRARIAILALLQSHEAEAQKCIIAKLFLSSCFSTI